MPRRRSFAVAIFILNLLVQIYVITVPVSGREPNKIAELGISASLVFWPFHNRYFCDWASPSCWERRETRCFRKRDLVFIEGEQGLCPHSDRDCNREKVHCANHHF